jgi:hypothetical protein
MNCENQINMMTFYWDIRKQLDHLISILLSHIITNSPEASNINLHAFCKYWTQLMHFSIHLNTTDILDNSNYFIFQKAIQLHTNEILPYDEYKTKASILYQNTLNTKQIHLSLAFTNFISEIKIAYQKFKLAQNVSNDYDDYFQQLVNQFEQLYFNIPSHEIKSQLIDISDEIAYMPPNIHSYLKNGGEKYKLIKNNFEDNVKMNLNFYSEK